MTASVDHAWGSVALVLAFACSLLAQPILITWLTRRQILDRPSERSSHVNPTPRGGGLVVVLSAALAMVVAGRDLWPFVLAILCFAGLGAVDDYRGIPARWRLVAQVLLATVTAFLVGPLVDLPVSGAPEIIVLALWLVVSVNAFNFMDGINGISTLQVLVVSAALATCSLVWGSGPLFCYAAALGGAALGFLPYNAVRARVFLGDVGSYGLGAALGLGIVMSISTGLPAAAAVALLAVYLVDVGWVLIKRAIAGKPLMSAHREHIYQRLALRTKSHGKVTCFATAASSLVALGAVLSGLTDERGMRVLGVSIALVALVGYVTSPAWWSAGNHGSRQGPETADTSA